jgi:3-deoxy-D-manno-octulosonic-acid transferase
MLVPWFLDAIYLLVLLLASPWLLWRAWRTGRYRHSLRDKLLGRRLPVIGLEPGSRPIWFHGVSVGEIHLLRQVIAAFRQRFPEHSIVVSSTTDTGLSEARKWFADLAVIPFPFDFSWAVDLTLRRINPALVVLAEGDLWPNFLLAAHRLGIPVAVINARMSPRSYARYSRLGPLPRWLLQHVSLFLTQDERHAANLRGLKVPSDRVFVTGSVKFDGSSHDRDNPKTRELGQLLQVQSDDLIWIAGSTQAPEEDILLRIYQKLSLTYPRLRLFLVPRHPERFNEVATLLEGKAIPYIRRSDLDRRTGSLPVPNGNGVVLIDTMGELGALWGLADLAFVGGSLDGKRGGQNMIDPAGYGVAVLFGPHVWNFRETASRLVEVGGALQVADAEHLEQVVNQLLASPAQRGLLGRAGQQFVLSQQGATARTLDRLTVLLPPSNSSRHASGSCLVNA